MDMTGEEQRIYEYMEHLPPHRSAEWNRLNRRWFLEYARWYGAVCGIPRASRQERSKIENADMDKGKRNMGPEKL